MNGASISEAGASRSHYSKVAHCETRTRQYLHTATIICFGRVTILETNMIDRNRASHHTKEALCDRLLTVGQEVAMIRHEKLAVVVAAVGCAQYRVDAFAHVVRRLEHSAVTKDMQMSVWCARRVEMEIPVHGDCPIRKAKRLHTARREHQQAAIAAVVRVCAWSAPIVI